MEKSIKIFDDINELSLFFANLLQTQLHHIPEGTNFSLALSGGSTPKAIFKYLASNFKETIQWDRILIFWGDERCVDPENNESNFKMTKENLLDLVPIPANQIFRIKGENNPVQESKRYSDTVCQNINLINGIPQFDIIMLGLGEDGHTASIFPDNLQLIDSEQLFEAVENPYSKQKRISATYKIINNASNVIFIVTGESKAEILAWILEKNAGFEKFPASFVQPSNGNLIWLLDKQSAKKLN